MSRRRALSATTVAARLVLEIRVRDDRQVYFLTVPLLYLTGLLFSLWSCQQALFRGLLALHDLAAVADRAATSFQVSLVFLAILAGALAWAIVGREVGPCRTDR